MLRTVLAVLTVLLVVCFAIGMLFLARRQGRREFASTEGKMQWLASEAVDIAEKNYNLDLDYSEESIEDVEIILGKIHDEYLQSKSETGLQGLAMAFGSYIGEVIRHRHAGARWERDHSIMGKESYPIHWQGGQSFPLQWCYKRIMSGPEENVWHKYLALSELRGTDTSREGKVTD